MLTSPADTSPGSCAPLAEADAVDDRPAYRPFRAAVTGVRTLSPSFVRVTLGGDDLAGFAPHGLDQRIKLVLPGGGVDPSVVLGASDWYAAWRALPERPPFRTYTVRDPRPEVGEIDVDVVVHDESGGPLGPAARWLRALRLGDELVVVGPDARSRESRAGIDWRPGAARSVLLAGDETAVPAVLAILDQLPDGIAARAFLEVPTASDTALPTAARDAITWLPREGRAHGELLDAAVRDWAIAHPELLARSNQPRPPLLDDGDDDLLWDSPVAPDAGVYAWMAGESGVIRLIRRHLVTDLGVDRRRVAFMGYWRRGRAEAA